MTFLHIPMKWALRWQHSTPFWSHQNNAFAQNMAFSRHRTFLSTLYIIETHPLRTSTAASDCLGQKFQEEDPARFLAPHGSRPAVSPTHTITGRWHVIVLPHFKKNRKISYSLSRISTVIMGFRSQCVALLQEKNRGCLMATFSREGWVITEALPPSTNVRSKDCQRGQSVSESPEWLFDLLLIFLKHKFWVSPLFSNSLFPQ